jgi:uncharacterized protein YecT (DUF1311 family)
MKIPRIITTIFGTIMIGTLLNLSSAYADNVSPESMSPVEKAELSALEARLEKAQNQRDMNIASGEIAKYLDKILTEKEAEIAKNLDPKRLKLFKEASRVWRDYRKAQSSFKEDGYRGGSMSPLIYNVTFSALTNERLADLID